MRYLKYVLFVMILFLVPNVYALDVSNKVEAIPDFGGGTYYGQTPTSPTVAVYNNIGTRYQGKLSVISFYLDSNDWNWSYSRTYTIELYMETNDWDNNFMYPQVYRANTNGDTLGSNLAKSSVTFVSNKKIKFTFKTPDDVMNTYIKFRIYSTNYNTTGITRISNYNFNKVIITENQTSGGSGGGSGTSPTPTPTPSNSTDAIIDSSIQNTEDIINNNNQNTQDIIENANNNFSQATDTITGTLDELLGNKCENLFSTNAISGSSNGITYTVNEDGTITLNGTASANTFINLGSISFTPGTYTLSGGIDNNRRLDLRVSSGGNIYNNIINGSTPYTFTINENVTLYLTIRIGSGSTINNTIKPMIVKGSTSKPYCTFGSIFNKLDETNQEIKDLNDKLDGLNHIIESAQVDDKSSFFTNFEDDDHGLTGIITAPLSTIQALANTSCVPLSIPIPFTNSNVNLPCMTQVYQTYVPTVFNLWQIVSFGIISYFICIDIFKMVKGFKDPNEDKVEVLDL